jgi:hypothetical protein
LKPSVPVVKAASAARSSALSAATARSSMAFASSGVPVWPAAVLSFAATSSPQRTTLTIVRWKRTSDVLILVPLSDQPVHRLLGYE